MCGVPWRVRALTCLLSAGAIVALSAPGAQASGPCDKIASPSGANAAQKLVDSLAAGQTGCLRTGTYRENLEIRHGGITVRGYPGEKATVVGEFEVHKTAPH